ncbi:hypothetical protein CJ030_MR6G029215 [Morella rubra]|uniref:BED-type domain-containing protein n=1 Tax=Morella rubra TaxID=262757 RepID=A0A6A1V9W5_9ROSI|nr:hypothetical protein CJ030_MR6G029215 [Morella rubra]
MTFTHEDKVEANLVDCDSDDDGNGEHEGNGVENKSSVVDDSQKSAFQRKPRKRTSTVWKDFKLVVKGGAKKAECNYCKGVFYFPPSGATTQFHRHLKSCLVVKSKE